MENQIKSIEFWRTGPLQTRVGIKRAASQWLGYKPGHQSLDRLGRVINSLPNDNHQKLISASKNCLSIKVIFTDPESA